MQIMKSGKRRMTEGMELLNQEEITPFREKESKNTREYWKLTPSDKWR